MTSRFRPNPSGWYLRFLLEKDQSSMLRGLVKLISHMDGLQRPPDMATLRRLLSEADVTPADMKVACKFNDVSYARTE